MLNGLRAEIMQSGSLIEAPEGWEFLRKGEQYHFLKSFPKQNKVLLVQLGGADENGVIHPAAQLIVLYCDDFESAVDEGFIQDTGVLATLPPWLEDQESYDFELADTKRRKPKKSHKCRVEDRLLKIAPALIDPTSWMLAENPEYALNILARDCGANETRFRCWTLTYLLCGRNLWALHSPWHHIGDWKRDQFGGKKFGRPSIAFGVHYGRGEDPKLTQRYIEGYEKFRRLGRPLTKIYDMVMVKFLRCKVEAKPGNTRTKIYVPPLGQGFYTYDQFRTRLIKKFGLEQIQRDLYGETRFRTKMAPSKGEFAEHLTNLMQEVEADAFTCAERPRGYLEGTSLLPLKVAVANDVLSSFGLGIGFSLGSERREAYRMMLFCMAVPKDYFCELFGLTISKEDWPSQGLPPNYVTDRGPGAALKLIEKFEDDFPIRELTPSYSGQSKATVESGNPRKRKLEGKPRYIQSKLTPVSLARKLIFDVIRKNSTRDVENKIELIPEMANVQPSPICFWDAYDRRGRNDALPMSIDDAVRNFLTHRKFKLKDGGVFLLGRKYKSAAFEATGVFQKLKRTTLQDPEIDGYVLDLCVRYVWIEYQNRTYRLEAQLKVGGDKEDLYISLSELEQAAEARSFANSEFRQSKRAASGEAIQSFEEQTGDDWDSEKIATGVPKQTATSKQEEREAKQQGSRGRSK